MQTYKTGLEDLPVLKLKSEKSPAFTSGQLTPAAVPVFEQLLLLLLVLCNTDQKKLG